MQFRSVQSLSRVHSVTPWTAAHQASLSITISRSLLKLTYTESVMPTNHLFLFSSCLQSFPTSGSLPVSQFFTSSGQSIEVSAFSISPSNEYSGRFPLRLIGLISLQIKGLSRVFSSTTVQKHQFFGAQFSL